MKLRLWAYLILLLLLVAVSYGNTLHSPFVLDDFSFVDTPDVYARGISFASLKILSNTVHGKARVIPMITFALDNYFGSGNIVQYHLTNIAVHLLCTVAIFLFIRALLVTKVGAEPLRYLSAAGFSLIATGLWALNPVQTNSVTYLVQRMTSIATLFYISSLVLYLYGRLARSSWQRHILLMSAAITAILAFLSKQNSFTLPVALLMVEFYFLSPGSLGRIVKAMKKSQWFFIILLTLLLLPLLVRYLQGILNGYNVMNFTLEQRLLTELRVVVFYISLLLLPLPSRLNLEHDFPLSVSFFSPPTTLLSLILLLALFIIGAKTKRSHPLISFGIMWFFLNLLIESTIVPLEIIYEHRLYLPSVGFFIVMISAFDFAAGSLSSRYPRQITKKLLVYAVVLFLPLSSILTIYRNNDWLDALTFYTDCVTKSPNKARPNNALGSAYAEKGDIDNAIKHYQIAIDLNPSYADAYNNLGLAYAEKGDMDNAIKHYQIAIDLDPYYANAYNNLGHLYGEMGLIEKAIEYYQQALQLRPDMPEPYNNLGVAYDRKGMVEKAIEAFQQSLKLKPIDPGVHNNLGSAYEKIGSLDKAIKEYREALRLRPDYAQAYNKLGIVYGKMGLADESIKHLLMALQLDPENPGYHNNIANAYMMKGFVNKAAEHRRQAAYFQGKN